MFKLFLNLIFNRTGATLNAGLGWLGGGTVLVILRKKYCQGDPSVQRRIIRRYYQNWRPNKYSQAVLSKRIYIIGAVPHRIKKDTIK